MKKKSADWRHVLARVYSRYQRHDDPKTNRLMKRDFVFHMSDWTEDLERLFQLYRDPGQFSKEEAGDIIAGFLLHASSHIDAAASLLLDFKPLVFEDPRDAPSNGD